MKIRGKAISGGNAEGEALVSKMPFSFLGDLEIETGKIMVKGHDLEGQSIKGKIFVFPTGKGSTAGPNIAFLAKLKGNVPAGIILSEAEPVIAMVGIMNDIPMMHKLEKDPVEVIQNGDYVKMDVDKGMIEIRRK
ncbi:MAG: aconitase X swivel domain-containing protein [Candidatus Thorarchaeota archaeon]